MEVKSSWDIGQEILPGYKQAMLTNIYAQNLLCGIVNSRHCCGVGRGEGIISHFAHDCAMCPNIYVPHCKVIELSYNKVM